MRFNSIYLMTALAITVAFTACKDDEDSSSYNIPDTYNFENVSYTGQSNRLQMLLEMKNYIKSGKSEDVTLEKDVLQAMYENSSDDVWENGPYTKQIKSKTFADQQSVYETLFDQAVVASASTEAYSPGTPGVATKADGSKSYLLNDKGLEPVQIIEKGLMGACFYYQATSVYMGAGKMDVDNEIVTDGEGTEMEHHWDEAFGYFGAPIDFPTNTDGLFFWANYCNNYDDLLNTNEDLMTALITGRAAISNNDLDTRDNQIDLARAAWERVSVGSALHYLNGAMANFDDVAVRNHEISEAIAFIYSLYYNEGKSVSNPELDNLLISLAGTKDLDTMDITEIEESTILSVRDLLADIFNISDDIKEQL